MKRLVEAIKDCGNLAILAVDSPNAVLHNVAILALHSLDKACDAMKEARYVGCSVDNCCCKKCCSCVRSDKSCGENAP